MCKDVAKRKNMKNGSMATPYPPSPPKKGVLAHSLVLMWEYFKRESDQIVKLHLHLDKVNTVALSSKCIRLFSARNLIAIDIYICHKNKTKTEHYLPVNHIGFCEVSTSINSITRRADCGHARNRHRIWKSGRLRLRGNSISTRLSTWP